MSTDSDIFITGYALRAPSSNNAKEFFDNLVSKTDLVTPTRRYPGKLQLFCAGVLYVLAHVLQVS